MKIRTITPEAAVAAVARVRSAPIAEPDTYHVARVGYLSNGTGGALLHPALGGTTEGITAYFETPAREMFRLPAALTPWAIDVVTLAVAGANPFPAFVEFGQDGDEWTADIQ